jgi:hypothetical protein
MCSARANDSPLPVTTDPVYLIMPSEPEIRRCRACNKILESWKSPYCSDACFDAGPSQAEPAPAAIKESDAVERQPATAAPPNPEPQPQRKGDVKLCACGNVIKLWRNSQCDQCLAAAAGAEPEPPNGNRLGTQRNVKCPTCGTLVNEPLGGTYKATPALLEAVVTDIGRGFTRAQACAKAHISPDTWYDWEKLPEFPTIRDEALAARLDYLLNAMEEAQQNKLDWRMFAWQAERVKAFREQFADPSKATVQINQQFNHGNLGTSQTDLEDARKRLDETKALQQARKRGNVTPAELREAMIRQIEECQHVVDCIDRDEVPDQKTRQKLYHDLEEGGDRHNDEPVKEVVGRVVDEPLALKEQGSPEHDNEPQRTSPQIHSMRASEMDWSSGQPKQPDDGGAPPEAPTEPEHVRQCDRPQTIGPLSERQRARLEWEKARRGGDGKQPW